MNYKIFISYSTKDLVIVEKLVEVLKSNISYLNIYVAEYKTPFGSIFARDVIDAIWKCDTFIVLWTSNAERSRWVQFETSLAYGLGKEIIPIKFHNKVEMPEYLLGYKGLWMDNYQILRIGFDALVKQIKYKVNKYHFKRWLINQIRLSKYAISENEEKFYIFANKVLSQSRSENIIFVSGTPALLLPTETYTHNRKKYLDTLLYRFSKKNNLTKGIYLFNYRKTINRLKTNPIDKSKFTEHIKRIKPVLNSPDLDVYGLKHLLYLPSGILTENEGAILVRDPSILDKLIGIYFVKGKELEYLRNRLYFPIIKPKNIYYIKTVR